MSQEQALRRLMFNLATLEELGEVLGASGHYQDTLQTALCSLTGALPAARGVLYLHHPRREELELETSRGIVSPGSATLPLPEPVARGLARVRRPVLVEDPPAGLAAWVSRCRPDLDFLDARLLVPLRFKDELVGLAAVGPKFGGGGYSADDLEIAMVVGNYLAISLHNQELFQRLERTNVQLRRKVVENRRLYRDLEGMYDDTVRALAAAIDAKDPYTRGHSERVSRVSLAVARSIGLPEVQIHSLRIAGYLHDIGKIAVDNSVLLKCGKLSEDERAQINRHPAVAYDILSHITFPYPDVALIARHHHEWVNGTGYPDKLGIEQLNAGMKILTLADSFDAMTSDRPYRPALPLEDALRRIRQGVHVQFDVQVAVAFFRAVRDEVTGHATRIEITDHVARPLSERQIVEVIDSALEGLVPPAQQPPDPAT